MSAAVLLICPTAPAAVGLDADAHLVGHWKFDESSGQTAADASGKGHPGTLQGQAAFGAGRVGNALKLEGKGDGVTVTGFKGVTGQKTRTIAAWIKTDTSKGEIVSWGLDDAGKMWTFGFVRGRTGVTPKGGYLYMKAETHDNQWHHVAVAVEEASPPNLHDNVKLYLDGTPAEIHDIGLLDLWPIDTGDQLEVRIGRNFKGLVDDLRIYDRALSEDEIMTLFKSAK